MEETNYKRSSTSSSISKHYLNPENALKQARELMNSFPQLSLEFQTWVLTTLTKGMSDDKITF
jgi:hypothetical protein